MVRLPGRVAARKWNIAVPVELGSFLSRVIDFGFRYWPLFRL